MKKLLKRMLLTIITIIALLALSVYFFMQHDKFGSLPKGERLERIQSSPNFRDGQFQNLNHTPDLSEGASYYSILKEFLFTKRPNLKPVKKLPSTKTDLLSLDSTENVIVWFGHSSYFMQLDGRTFLVDPVLSGAASPIAFTTRAFEGTDVYTPADFPDIDYLLISHDHWDHLDYETILALEPKIDKVITGLGTGAHFEHWGFDTNTIIEEDWNTKISLDSGFTIHTVPGRHFAGRGFKRNQALWTAFVVETPNNKIFVGGDSGYDTHFKTIGEQHGPFDLAILENGQYDKSWKYIHMMPEEVVQATIDLKSKALFPVHSSKFALGNHAWNEPLSRVSKAAHALSIPVVTPIIGEKVALDDSTQTYTYWWEEVE